MLITLISGRWSGWAHLHFGARSSVTIFTYSTPCWMEQSFPSTSHDMPSRRLKLIHPHRHLHHRRTLLQWHPPSTHQGCALATHGACLPYHIKLHKVQLRHPSIRMIVYGDDTTAHGTGKRLYGRSSVGLLSWREGKERLCAPLGHVAHHNKELCCTAGHRPACSDLEHAPADLAGSPRHPGGPLGGFKIVGCYFGERDWRRRQLAVKVVARLSPLDAIDRRRRELQTDPNGPHHSLCCWPACPLATLPTSLPHRLPRHPAQRRPQPRRPASDLHGDGGRRPRHALAHVGGGS